MKRFLALMLCAAVAAPGCAPTIARQTRPALPTARQAQAEAMVMADYVRQLPIGSRVRIARTDGRVLRATLMKNDGDPIVVQRRTRIPEPPIDIRVADVVALELDTPKSGIGRTGAISAAAAAGATLGVLMLLAAIYSD